MTDRVSHEMLSEWGGVLAPLFGSRLVPTQSDTGTCRTPKASRNRATNPCAFLFASIRVIRGQKNLRKTFNSEQFALPGNQQTCRAGLVSRDRLQCATWRDEGRLQAELFG